MVRALAAGLVAVVACASARGQYFNIDLDANGDVPDAAFGGAALQPGFWNGVQACDEGPRLLRDLGGELTQVTYTFEQDHANGMSCGWFNNQDNTGGYAALLNDTLEINYSDTIFTFTFSGLDPGAYRVITYAVRRGGQECLTPVEVIGSESPNPQFVTGPMPGDSFVLGVTHALHDVDITDGTIRVVCNLPLYGNDFSSINGFQIAPVPAPPVGVAVVGGLLLVRRGRRAC